MKPPAVQPAVLAAAAVGTDRLADVGGRDSAVRPAPELRDGAAQRGAARGGAMGEVGQSYALLSAQATKVSAEHSHRSLLPLQTAAIVTDKYVCKQVQVCTGVAQL